MIKTVKGNVLNHEGIIAHQVNCQGVMGAGLAKQIRATYPEAYRRYVEVCNSFEKKSLLGRTQVINVGNKYVANVFGQYTYGRYGRHTDYEALTKAMDELMKKARKAKRSVGMPYGIGCGLAGGEWSVVYGIIEQAASKYKVEVTLYQL